jgi:beta-lactamase regulating signal transducer with metallopeptidase domain/lipopolysaccharide export system protein LptA
MTAAEVLDALLKVNLASGAAILAVAALRKPARARFGARLAYGLWLLPVLAGAAVLLPARQVLVVRTAAPMVATVNIGGSLGAPPVHTVAAAPAGLDGLTLLVALWLAGVAVATLVMAVLQHRFVARARQGGVGPAVVGLIAPRILVPRDFGERYSLSEQTLVLAHEQAHLKRQDSRLNGLVAALQCLHWFNPLVHLAARLMRVDQELACDEAVVSRFPDARRAYAEVLMKAQLAVLPLPLGCYWPSRSQHPLVERVAMLKRPRIGRIRWRAGAAILGCLWAGAGLAAWASQPAQVRTVFKAAPVAEGPGEAMPSDEKAADTAPRPVAAPAPDRSAVAALAAANAPPQPILLPRRTMQVDRVLIANAQRIDREKILSLLAIRPGDTVTVDKINAADKALFDSGLFSDWNIQAPSLGGSGDLRVWVKEKPLIADAQAVPSPRPDSPKPGTWSTTVQRVVIEGNKRVDQATILSKLAIRPGQVLRGGDLEAALKRLYDTGQFKDTGQFAMFEVQPPPRGGSGDLVIRVVEAPLINQLKIEGNAHFNDFRLRALMQQRPEAPLSGAKLQSDADAIVELYREAGWPDTKVTYRVSDLPQERVDVTLTVDEGAKEKPGDLPGGLITVNAAQVNREEVQHRVVFRGDVVAVQKGRRMLSDLLILTSRAPDDPGGPGIKEARWEGDVRFDMGDAAATADRAVYDGGSKTFTLSGHVVVQRGPWIVRNDKLVIDAKD